VLGLVIESHPYRTLADSRRKPVRCLARHGPTFSGIRVSENPGTVQNATLKSVRCPVLAVHGDEDEYGSSEHPSRIAAGRGTAHILAKTGHVPHRENEKLLIDVIHRFLRGI
jgi:pimeloyl-ACP methyl ester carboxylesterase